MSLLGGIARYLDDLDLVDFDEQGVGGDCFVDFMPDQPDQAVAIYGYGGPEASAKFGYDHPRVQIKVRGGPDPRVSRGRLADIYDALHGLSHVTLPDGTWIEDCAGIQSDPQTLGRDGNQRHSHVINFEFEVRNPARPAV